jgi:hypothetical protein
MSSRRRPVAGFTADVQVHADEVEGDDERSVELVGEGGDDVEREPSPAELLAADPQVLRASGFSASKGETLRALAERASSTGA